MHPLLNPVRAGVIMLMEQCSETKKLRNVRRRKHRPCHLWEVVPSEPEEPEPCGDEIRRL